MCKTLETLIFFFIRFLLEEKQNKEIIHFYLLQSRKLKNVTLDEIDSLSTMYVDQQVRFKIIFSLKQIETKFLTS